MFKPKKNRENNNINLLNYSDNQSPKGRPFFKVSKFIVYMFTTLIIIFFIFTYQILFTNSSFISNIGGTGGFFKQLTSIAHSSDDLKGLEDDRINILLLGVGGAGHDGPNLTDTIMIASIKPSTKTVGFISIPRDTLVDIPGQGLWKINNANHFGEKEKTGHGPELTSQVVSNITGIPIHYYIRVDFSGFEQIIDDLGGVKVYVDRNFVDYQYPTANYKYQVVSFEQGFQTMDGDTALKFARSRHGNNDEGSDFARSKRQQKIISASKERAFSFRTLFNPSKLNKMLKTLDDHIATNLSISEIIELYKLSKNLDTDNPITLTLDDGPNGFLFSSMVNSAYVLQPRGGNYNAISSAVKHIFDQTTVEVPKTQNASIEIRNGTTVNGLAFSTSQTLKEQGYQIIKIGNAPSQTYPQTLIYQLQANADTEALNNLITNLDADFIEEIPSWIREDAELTTDYYIILGDEDHIDTSPPETAPKPLITSSTDDE
ncbi:hypothetical protein COT97_02115 [Candidatus Falkowbacteria bacterium CG10_big_fil_rev_8_21_14_0_10_39_11]|uniref:Cell envelope-related transcriptional attenuator domain-containing protein n=1 Tax=Candidatus Falkowbacteria bacterium CG10_big_fil_rev_8_21_14_0_10_39_11 TaxID=1974565 RepID=A0A2H0V579_9BACT|nr:MAG: hypothetical protein COT97_02115 [Candidatus Falkowbacteria bacterium CG10_big_fil_rev_8_21_14_0_10_39_11]